jgi:hypothetical protein
MRSEPRRWLSVGSSTGADSRAAGSDAARQALSREDARLVVVFCSGRHDPSAVLAGITEVSGDVPLIGCSTSVAIAPDGPYPDRAVVVVGLGGPGFSVATAVGRDASRGQRAAGIAVAGCTAEVAERPNQILVLLSDGMAQRQEEILGGVYSIVGASVPYVGGTSSPDPATRRTFAFHGGPGGSEVLTDAVVGATIASDGPLGVGVRHGWRKVGEPMIVTSSTGGEVFTLDDQPAIGAYLRQLGAPADAYADPHAFERFARTRPIGIRRRSGEEVRNVSSMALFDLGRLRSSGDVPEGGLVWLMEGDEESVLDAAGDACRDAVAALGGASPLGLFAFDCESRAMLFGPEGMRHEVARMTGAAGGAPVAGLYTWGEVARLRGINGFHNQTLVVLAVG